MNEIDGLKLESQSLKRDVWALATEIIPKIQGKLDELNVDALSGHIQQITTNKTDIAAHSDLISQNTSTISQNSKKLTDHEALLADHTTKINKNVSDIASAASSISSLSNEAASFSAAIDQHIKKITANETSIASHTTTIGEHTESLSTLGSTVSLNTTRLNAHDDRFKVCEDQARAIVQLQNSLVSANQTLENLTTRLQAAETYVSDHETPTIIYDKNGADYTTHHNFTEGLNPGDVLYSTNFFQFKRLRFFVSAITGYCSVFDFPLTSDTLTKISLHVATGVRTFTNMFLSFNDQKTSLTFDEMSHYQVVGTSGSMVQTMWFNAASTGQGHIYKIEGYKK